jgi:hypothetical protein
MSTATQCILIYRSTSTAISVSRNLSGMPRTATFYLSTYLVAYTFQYSMIADNFQICVGFPQQVEYHRLEKLVMVDKLKRFMARPPPPKIDYANLSPVQRWAVDLMSPITPTTSTARPSRRTRRTKMSADDVEKPQVLYLCGRAGSGKTEVALHLCQRWKVLYISYFLCLTYNKKLAVLSIELFVVKFFAIQSGSRTSANAHDSRALDVHVDLRANGFT